jgi:hypothetical protein
VRIHNHKTGTEKIAPAFALSTYYDVMRPKGAKPAGADGLKSTIHTAEPPSHADIESQLAKSIAGQHYGDAPAPAGVPPTGTGGFDISGKHFVITGNIPNMTRKEAEAKLAAKGGYPHSSISSQVDLLITGEHGAGGATKVAAAKKKGVKIVGYPEVAHLFEAELDPQITTRLRQLERVEVALMETGESRDIVRLRARRRALLESLELEERFVSAEKRKQLAAKGHALPGGVFPIETAKDAENAATLYNSGHHKTPEARAHILRNAKRVGASVSLN